MGVESTVPRHSYMILKMRKGNESNEEKLYWYY